MARPTIYTKALCDAICTRLAGGESLRSICNDDAMPTKSTVLLWVVDGEHDEFSDQYRRAREAAGYAHADSIIDAVERVNTDELRPDAARVMMDGLKWAAERMAPKAHSPRQQLEHSGKIDQPLVIVMDDDDQADQAAD